MVMKLKFKGHPTARVYFHSINSVFYSRACSKTVLETKFKNKKECEICCTSWAVPVPGTICYYKLLAYMLLYSTDTAK